MSETAELEVRRQRAAQNQSVFRNVNERIEDLAASAAFPTFVCECLDTSCGQSLALTVEEYEHVRSHANRFVVVPGHDVADVEEILEASEPFLVVAKLGSGAEVAARHYPRSQRDA